MKFLQKYFFYILHVTTPLGSDMRRIRHIVHWNLYILFIFGSLIVAISVPLVLWYVKYISCNVGIIWGRFLWGFL